MATYLLSMLVFLVLISFSGAAAASSQDCSGQAQSMMPCFAYIGGEPSEPSAECCTSLRTSDSTCTCTLLSLLATAVNQNNSLLLPNKCGIQNLTPTQCKAVAAAGGDVAPSMAPMPGGSRPPSSSSGSSSTPSIVLGSSSDSTMRFLVSRVAMMLVLLSLGMA